VKVLKVESLRLPIVAMAKMGAIGHYQMDEARQSPRERIKT
jgi:hypothetical protein